MSDRVFGVPGASLLDAAEAGRMDPKMAELGRRGELKAAEELDQWVEQHDNARVFHSISLPGKDFDADHLLVVGNIVFMIDTKLWRPGSYHFTPTERGAEVTRDGEEFEGGVLSMNWETKTWSNFLEGLNEGAGGWEFHSILNLVPSSGSIQYNDDRINDFIIVTLDQLTGVLDSFMGLFEHQPWLLHGDMWRKVALIHEHSDTPFGLLPRELQLASTYRKTAPKPLPPRYVPPVDAYVPSIPYAPPPPATPVEDPRESGWRTVATWSPVVLAMISGSLGGGLPLLVAYVATWVAFVWGCMKPTGLAGLLFRALMVMIMLIMGLSVLLVL